MGGQKSGGVSCTKHKQLKEHFATDYVTWQQIIQINVYKKIIIERQSFSQIQTGGGLQICNRLCLQIVEQWQNNFINVKLSRRGISHHLQRIMSSKHAKVKAEIHYQMQSPGPWAAMHEKLLLFCHSDHCMASGTLPQINICAQSSKVKCECELETLRSFLGKSSFKTTNTALCSDESKSEILFGKNRRCILHNIPNILSSWACIAVWWHHLTKPLYRLNFPAASHLHPQNLSTIIYMLYSTVKKIFTQPPFFLFVGFQRAKLC